MKNKKIMIAILYLFALTIPTIPTTAMKSSSQSIKIEKQNINKTNNTYTKNEYFSPTNNLLTKKNKAKNLYNLNDNYINAKKQNINYVNLNKNNNKKCLNLNTYVNQQNAQNQSLNNLIDMNLKILKKKYKGKRFYNNRGFNDFYRCKENQKKEPKDNNSETTYLDATNKKHTVKGDTDTYYLNDVYSNNVIKHEIKDGIDTFKINGIECKIDQNGICTYTQNNKLNIIFLGLERIYVIDFNRNLMYQNLIKSQKQLSKNLEKEFLNTYVSQPNIQNNNIHPQDNKRLQNKGQNNENFFLYTIEATKRHYINNTENINIHNGKLVRFNDKKGYNSYYRYDVTVDPKNKEIIKYNDAYDRKHTVKNNIDTFCDYNGKIEHEIIDGIDYLKINNVKGCITQDGILIFSDGNEVNITFIEIEKTYKYLKNENKLSLQIEDGSYKELSEDDKNEFLQANILQNEQFLNKNKSIK